MKRRLIVTSSVMLLSIGLGINIFAWAQDRDFAGQMDAGAARDKVRTVAYDVACDARTFRLNKSGTLLDAQVNAPQRATVLLFYRESLNCQEIGEILNMPAATVKSHLHRARARLKDSLSERMEADWTQVRFAEMDAEPRRTSA